MGTSIRSPVRKTRATLLKLFYEHPDEAYYFQQIRRRTGARGVGTVQRELRNLEEIGLITKLQKGSQVHYQANQANPIYPEMRALVNKTIGIFHILSVALQPVANRVRVAFVYGSVARRQENVESDVDIIVVGEVSLPEILENFSSAEKEIARPINPTVYSVAEFTAKMKARNHFLTAVISKEKFFLIGDEDELRALRKE